jgi:thiol-disulfide isomerase/thioredoxin
MSPVLILSALALVFVSLALRRVRISTEGPVPLPVAVIIVVAMCSIVVAVFAREDPAIAPRQAFHLSAATGPAPATGHALQRGALAPKESAEGWVNGKPAAGARVRVIDVWAPWCLVCHEMAPRLVRLHNEYRSKGVQFISLTDMSQDAVEAFVGHFDIPWSSGYGTPKESIDAFRALRASVLEPDRQIAPTLYVLDSKGRVLWTDDAGRFRHEKVDDLVNQLAAQLDAALAGAPTPSSIGTAAKPPSSRRIL